jgi:hypothetical protein
MGTLSRDFHGVNLESAHPMIGLFTRVIPLLPAPLTAHSANLDDNTLRVFIFAGQSNMVGADSKTTDVSRDPSIVGGGHDFGGRLESGLLPEC